MQNGIIQQTEPEVRLETELTADEEALLDDVFSYHSPTNPQIEKYQELRSAAKDFARTIMRLAPASADRTVALRCVREAVMNANASIALNGVMLK